MKIKVLVGKKIKSARSAKKLTQEQLAELLEVHHTYIGEIERGKRNITIETLFRIATALEIRPMELLRFYPVDDAFLDNEEELQVLIATLEKEDKKVLKAISQLIGLLKKNHS